MKNGLSLAVVAVYYLTNTALAVPPTNPNLAVRQVVQEVIAQLPSDSTSIAIIPLRPTQPELYTICQVLTSMLASRLTTDVGNRFVGLDRQDWERFTATTHPKRVRQYGEILRCRWLITGNVTQSSDLSIGGNLFLWDTETGYLNHWADFQLQPSVALATSSAKRQPYARKGLPYRSHLVLAVEVADVDGDGFNELLIADEKRVKALTWAGSNFRKHPHLSEIRYEADETPLSDRTHRTMLAADLNGNDLDELYIGQPAHRDKIYSGHRSDLTWRVEWQTDAQPLVSQLNPIFLARRKDDFIAAKTAENRLNYEGKSTVCFVWRANGGHSRRPCGLPVDYHSIATYGAASEVFVINLEGHLQAYQVTPNATSLIWQTPPLFGEGLAVGDLDADGLPEIVVTVGEAENQIYDKFFILEKKAALYSVGWTSPPFEGKIVDLKIADSDNNDRNELIVCLRNRRGSEILMFAATD